MEKMRLIILLTLLLVIFFYGAALGANTSYTCVIDQIGMRGNGQVRVQLSALSGEFDHKWFCCTQDVNKEMLAILLTASANDMVVRIWTDLQKGPEPEIINLFMFP